MVHTHRGQLTAALGGAAMGNFRANGVRTGTFPLFYVAGTITCGLAAFIASMELLEMSPGGLHTPALVQSGGTVKTMSIGAVLEVPLNGADISVVRASVTGATLLPPAVGERFRWVTGYNLYEV